VDDEVLLDPDFGYLQEDRYYVVYGETYKRQASLLAPEALGVSNDAASDTGIEIPTVLDITIESESGISYELPEAYEKAGDTFEGV